MMIKVGLCAVLAAAMLLILTVSMGSDAMAFYITGTIHPGDCGLHSKYQTHNVSRNITSLFVNLTWDNPSTKLVLTIHKPNGEVFGIYYPAGGDGKYQTQIQVFINNLTGVENGTWGYYVSYEEGTAITTYHI